MKFTLLALSILVFSANAFATTEEEFSPPMQYSIMPMAGLQLAGSELGGANKVCPVGFIGAGFRMLRDGFFFMPSVKAGVANFSLGTQSYWAVGFIAGGHVEFLGFDIFAGADYQTFMNFQGPVRPSMAAGLVDGTPVYKIGGLVNIGSSGIQLAVSGFYGQFTQHVTLTDLSKLNVYYPYLGGEVALQFPIGL